MWGPNPAAEGWGHWSALTPGLSWHRWLAFTLLQHKRTTMFLQLLCHQIKSNQMLGTFFLFFFLSNIAKIYFYQMLLPMYNRSVKQFESQCVLAFRSKLFTTVIKSSKFAANMQKVKISKSVERLPL